MQHSTRSTARRQWISGIAASGWAIAYSALRSSLPPNCARHNPPLQHTYAAEAAQQPSCCRPRCAGLDIARCVATARILMPRTVVRLSAGRMNFSFADQVGLLCCLACPLLAGCVVSMKLCH